MVDHTLINKTAWLALGRSFYTYLLQKLEELNEAEWQTRTSYLGWTCKDLLNHMTSAITVNFNYLLGLSLAGNPVPPSGFNLFQRNADEVARRRRLSADDCIEEFRKEIFLLLDKLDQLSEEQ